MTHAFGGPDYSADGDAGRGRCRRRFPDRWHRGRQAGGARATASKAWRLSIRGRAEIAASRFWNSPAADQIALLEAVSADANSEAGRFFQMIKAMTIDGYYTTREGLEQELGWHGNTYLTSFPGCTHPEHKG